MTRYLHPVTCHEYVTFCDSGHTKCDTWSCSYRPGLSAPLILSPPSLGANLLDFKNLRPLSLKSKKHAAEKRVEGMMKEKDEGV